MSKHFHIVSRPGCPFCSLVKHDLTKLGHTFEETTLYTEALRDDFKDDHGVKTFPQVFEGDVRIGGYEDTIEYVGAVV